MNRTYGGMNMRRGRKSTTMLRRVFALVLALVMVLAFSATALADGTTLDANGEQGAFEKPDTPISQEKTVVLSKSLVGYNAGASTVKAPDIKYTYTIVAATGVEDLTITDAENKHDPEHSVTAPVKAGVGEPSITATIAWTPAEDLTTDTVDNGGSVNTKDISINFGNVVFPGAGVYRYKVTEDLADGYDYPTSGVTADANESRIRYVDVYVRPAQTGYTDGSTAAEWDIYGFTCFVNNTSITDDDKDTEAVKTAGFVGTGTTDDDLVEPDSYYTYNVTITKNVENDAYGAQHSDFPFTVIFTNDAITTQVDIIGTGNDNDKVKGFVDPAKQAFDPTAKTISGIVTLMDGGTVSYVGIPCGTDLEVYETNDETGVTYSVSTKLNDEEAVVDTGVISGSTPETAVAQADPKAAYQSTKVTADTTADEYEDTAYAIDVTNKLENISPTGVILRYAPYMLILAGGILLLVLGTKLLRRSRREEE